MKKLVIIPGGFHPFHAGHKALYDAAREAFPSAEVYIAATDDQSSRPFPITIKQKLAKLAGIPPHRFIQVKSPFRAQEITQHFDPNETQLIFARSEKDRDQPPRSGGVKKDGADAYLQPYKRTGLEPMSKHGYMAYLPTVQFGPGMTSGTEIRAKWPGMSPEQKARLINQLYPATEGNDKLTSVTVRMLDAVLGEEIKEFAPVLAALGGLAGGAVAGELGLGSVGSAVARGIGSSVASSLANNNDIDEARLINDPDAGHQIIPDGGMGTWNEESMVNSLAGKFAEMVNMVKNKNYSGLQHVLYQGGVVKSLVDALVQYEKFMQKQGRRPMARGREIDMGKMAEDYIEEKTDPTPGKIDKNEDPCWNGYHMVGKKKKNGREVPNCVPGDKGK